MWWWRLIVRSHRQFFSLSLYALVLHVFSMSINRCFAVFPQLLFCYWTVILNDIATWHITCLMSHVICQVRHVTCHTWLVTYDKLHVMCHVWHVLVTHVTNHVMWHAKLKNWNARCQNANTVLSPTTSLRYRTFHCINFTFCSNGRNSTAPNLYMSVLLAWKR